MSAPRVELDVHLVDVADDGDAAGRKSSARRRGRAGSSGSSRLGHAAGVADAELEAWFDAWRDF